MTLWDPNWKKNYLVGSIVSMCKLPYKDTPVSPFSKMYHYGAFFCSFFRPCNLTVSRRLRPQIWCTLVCRVPPNGSFCFPFFFYVIGLHEGTECEQTHIGVCCHHLFRTPKGNHILQHSKVTLCGRVDVHKVFQVHTLCEVDLICVQVHTSYMALKLTNDSGYLRNPAYFLFLKNSLVDQITLLWGPLVHCVKYPHKGTPVRPGV